MYISKVIELISEYQYQLVDSEIVLTEQAVETYFMRLILIGLRLKGVSYKQAQEIIMNKFVKTDTALDVALNLIDNRKAPIVLEKESIKTISSLFMKFSRPYRNKLEHSGVGGITDTEIIRTCININTAFIREMDYQITSEMGHSAFVEPKEWGARRSGRIFTDTEIDNLKLGGKACRPIKKEEASRKLNEFLSGLDHRLGPRE